MGPGKGGGWESLQGDRQTEEGSLLCEEFFRVHNYRCYSFFVRLLCYYFLSCCYIVLFFVSFNVAPQRNIELSIFRNRERYAQ